MFPHSNGYPFGDEKCCSLVPCYLRAKRGSEGTQGACGVGDGPLSYPRDEVTQRLQSCSSKTGIRRIPSQGSATGFDEVDEAVVQCSRGSRDDRSEWVASHVPGYLERGSKTSEGAPVPPFRHFKGRTGGFDAFALIGEASKISFVARREEYTEVLIG